MKTLTILPPKNWSLVVCRQNASWYLNSHNNRIDRPSLAIYQIHQWELRVVIDPDNWSSIYTDAEVINSLKVKFWDGSKNLIYAISQKVLWKILPDDWWPSEWESWKVDFINYYPLEHSLDSHAKEVFSKYGFTLAYWYNTEILKLLWHQS